MKFLRFYIIYRLPIALGLIAFGIVSHLYIDTILAWICYVVAFVSVLLYFMMGTMRLVQDAVTEGDVELAMKYLNMIRFPKLLFKPIRVGYYMLQSNLALASNNLDHAEQNIRQSLKTKSTIAGDTQGTSLLQLGFVQLRKGQIKEGRLTLMEALKVGIPDSESRAAAHLQLCALEAERRQFRVAKDHFRKAKALKPKSDELVKQIQQIEKQIARMPG